MLNRFNGCSYGAHKKEPTSIVNSLNIGHYSSMMKEFMGKLVKDRSLIVVTKNGKVVGVIGMMLNPKKKRVHVGTIAIDPKHQGKGLSQMLYREALGETKRRGINRYTGFTTTHKVLNNLKNLKREIYGKHLILKV